MPNSVMHAGCHWMVEVHQGSLPRQGNTRNAWSKSSKGELMSSKSDINQAMVNTRKGSHGISALFADYFLFLNLLKYY